MDGPVYEYLGLSVGVILSSMDNEAKRSSYSKDVTYGTNNEFGFDYLRDNMKWSEQEKIQTQAPLLYHRRNRLNPH